MSEYFKTKSKCSQIFVANVIYKCTCSANQRISYIGDTVLQIFRRIADYKGRHKHSAIFDHVFSCESCMYSIFQNNFKSSEAVCSRRLYSLESMIIEEEKPKLNTQIVANGKAALYLLEFVA